MTTTPKIVGVHSAGPGIIELLLETTGVETGIGTVPDVLDVAIERYSVNGRPLQSVHRWSVPCDEAPADTSVSPNRFSVTVRHHLYLTLGQPFQDGVSYAIACPYGNAGIVFGSKTTFASCLKTNQAAYSGLATARFGNLAVWLGSGGTRAFNPLPAYDVIDERTGTVVLSGTVVDRGDDMRSGERVYRIPLGSLPVGGPYFVAVPGVGRSRSFYVGGEAYRKTAYVAVRGLYHQRCGIALERPYTEHTRAICHTRVADTRTSPWSPNGRINVPAGMATFPIRGLYHDAGDFDRRPQHTIIPILLLNYLEGFPERFTDRQYNLPESGNGQPDFLDEALWGVLGFENLQVTNASDPQRGGVRAGTEMAHHPGYGLDSAASDDTAYGTWEVKDYVTVFAAGMFAQASRLLRPFDVSRADALRERALLAWAYLERTTDVTAIKSHLLYATLQIYLATGDQVFHDRFKRLATEIVVKPGTWPEQYLPGNVSAACQTVFFVSYLLSQAQPVDATLAEQLKAKIFAGANSGGYMQVSDTPYPMGVTRFYNFGATTAQGRYADVYLWAARLTADETKRQEWINIASALMDYSLGLNPLGMSFYTGLGTDQPNSPLHLDSWYTKMGLSDGVTDDHVGKPIGNVPGILIYGATEGRSNAAYQLAATNKLLPSWDALPILRRYADGWSNVNSNEFSTHETIAWNIGPLTVLAGPAPAPAPSPPSPTPNEDAQPVAVPLDALKRVVSVIGDLETLRSAIDSQVK